MKQADVVIGRVYAAMVSGKLSPVYIHRISTRDSIYGRKRWRAYGINKRTERDVEFRSARRLQYEVVKGVDGKWHRVGGDA